MQHRKWKIFIGARYFYSNSEDQYLQHYKAIYVSQEKREGSNNIIKSSFRRYLATIYMDLATVTLDKQMQALT